MERRATIEEAKQLFGEYFIGFDEIAQIATHLGVALPAVVPEFPFTKAEMQSHANDCIILLGVEKMYDGRPLTLSSLRDRFGIDPDLSEPCFYNQDWYLKEDFMNCKLESKWYLVMKDVFEDSRAVSPSLLEKRYQFPPAVLCAYTFFTCWLHAGKILWQHDFVWCSDLDHNGDRIYVGKYLDIGKVNKNGFSIHRHLALRSAYGAISVY